MNCLINDSFVFLFVIFSQDLPIHNDINYKIWYYLTCEFMIIGEIYVYI